MKKATEIAVFMLIGATLSVGVTAAVMTAIGVVVVIGHYAFALHPLSGVAWVAAVVGAFVGFLAYMDRKQ